VDFWLSMIGNAKMKIVKIYFCSEFSKEINLLKRQVLELEQFQEHQQQ